MPYHLSQPLGNNSFSYDQRRQLGSDTTLVISQPCEISSLDQVQLGDFVVFEEVDHNGKIQSCTWLAHTYILRPPYERGNKRGIFWPAIVITDNHNHVLPYWLNFITQQQDHSFLTSQHPSFSLIHIDQHSDLWPNSNQLDLNSLSSWEKVGVRALGNDPSPSLQEEGSGGGYIRNFAHLECNIGNFITPCIESWLITNMTQIRTEYSLNEKSEQQWILRKGQIINDSNKKLWFTDYDLWFTIVDIDLDFWAPEMWISDIAKTMEQVRTIMDQADLITIATSPYFIDQWLALDLLHQLLEPRFQSQEEIEISEKGSWSPKGGLDPRKGVLIPERGSWSPKGGLQNTT
jgi:hypothetical protein